MITHNITQAEYQYFFNLGYDDDNRRKAHVSRPAGWSVGQWFAYQDGCETHNDQYIDGMVDLHPDTQ